MTLAVGRWSGFTDTELVELTICLDHRVVEAETGNAFADWETAGRLYAEMLTAMPWLAADSGELPELQRRLIRLRSR